MRGACAALLAAAGIIPLLQAAPPRMSHPVSRAGGPIVSASVDPFMSPEEEQRILDILARPMPFDWSQTTPQAIAQDLDPFVTTRVDERAIENLGLSAKWPLSLSGSSGGPSVGANLQAIFDGTDLTYFVRGGTLTFTTIDGAWKPENQIVRVYDVTPLAVHPLADGTRTLDGSHISELILTVIEPDTWPVSMDAIEGIAVRDRALMMITTTYPTHLRIQTLLDQLNAAPPVPDQEHL